MRSISQREMRNQSSEILRAVASGESVIVTNHGKPMAVLSPYIAQQTPLEQLRSLGQTRPPQSDRSALREISPAKLTVSAGELLRESRGSW